MATRRQEIERYLRETLGVRADLRVWRDRSRLPLYLRDSYQLFETELLGTPCLMMIDQSTEAPSPGAVRKQMDALRAKWTGELVYVRERVDASQRSRLIEQRLPFLVPGNQLYLPMLGVELREHFRKQRERSVTLMPATQMLVLQLLLRPHEALATPGEYAEQLGYTKMTMTRAFNELEDEQLCEVFKEGRERRLRLRSGRYALWESALPFLSSPVRRQRLVAAWDGISELPQAGLTALAQQTPLETPRVRVVAIAREEWKTVREAKGFEAQPRDEADSVEVQVWKYDPTRFSQDGRVDPLSLYLSLRDTNDERVEAALENLMEQVPW